MLDGPKHRVAEVDLMPMDHGKHPANATEQLSNGAAGCRGCRD